MFRSASKLNVLSLWEVVKLSDVWLVEVPSVSWHQSTRNVSVLWEMVKFILTLWEMVKFILTLWEMVKFGVPQCFMASGDIFTYF